MSAPFETSTRRVQRVDPRIDSGWAALTELHGDLFQTPAWMRVLSETYELEPSALVVCDSEGRARSGLVACEIEDQVGRRTISLPFSDYCDPLLGAEEDWALLADEWLGANVTARTRCLHSAAPRNDARLTEHGWAYWHSADLTRSEEDIWGGLRAVARRDARRAERAGIEVRAACDKTELRALFDLHLRLRKNKYHLLAQPYRYFETIWREFVQADRGVVLLAWDNGKVVAGTILLEACSKIYYKLNASDPDHLGQSPNDLLLWRALQYGNARGLHTFDFGVSDNEHLGLMRFKRKFATREERVTFLHRPVASAEGSGRAVWQQNLGELTRIFTAPDVPLEVSESAGDLLYRHFT